MRTDLHITGCESAYTHNPLHTFPRRRGSCQLAVECGLGADLLKACPHWQQIVAENGNKLLPEFVAVSGNCRFRQQSFRLWQQFVAENGNKVASVDRPLETRPTSPQQVCNKLATSRCNGIWETTQQTQPFGLLPAPCNLVTDLSFMFRTCCGLATGETGVMDLGLY